MKKLYEMPTIELTKFDVADVITASDGGSSEPTTPTKYTIEQFTADTGYNAVGEWSSAWTDAFAQL